MFEPSASSTSSILYYNNHPMTLPAPCPSSLPSLTLIVATTPSMGIGRAGALPWPTLKSELAYFARVTKRPPPPCTPNSSNRINAVIMGRKTWESIPRQYRPLRERINVVISQRGRVGVLDAATTDADANAHVHVATSLADGVAHLIQRYPHDATAPSAGDQKTLGRVFIIGGAEIYRTAMMQTTTLPLIPSVNRILWTRLNTEFPCDTFFPVNLNELVTPAEPAPAWVSRSPAEWQRWTGELGRAHVQVEQGVEYEFRLLERVAPAAATATTTTTTTTSYATTTAVGEGSDGLT